jgi:hypothetical protein
MKFVFKFPAKLVFAESNHVPRKVDCDFPIYSFDNQNVFFSRCKEKVVSEKCDSTNCYFFLIDDHLTYVGTRTNDESIIDLFTQLGKEEVDKTTALNSFYFKNPHLYEQEQAQILNERREKLAEEDKVKAEQKRLAEEKQEVVYKSALEDFKSDKFISWDSFERACKENNIKIPIKVIGYGRKSVSEIAPESYRYRGNPSKTLMNISSELKNALTGEVSSVN